MAIENEDELDARVLCLFAEIAFLRMDKEHRAKHVQNLRRITDEACKRDLQKVIEASTKFSAVCPEESQVRLEKRLFEVCELLELESAKTQQALQSASLVDVYKKRAEEAERDLADAQELRANDASKLEETMDQNTRLRARLDAALVKIEQAENLKKSSASPSEKENGTKSTSGARIASLERELHLTRSRNTQLQAELSQAQATIRESTSQRTTRAKKASPARRTTRSSLSAAAVAKEEPQYHEQKAQSLQGEMMQQLEADNASLRSALAEKEAQLEKASEDHVSVSLLESRLEWFTNRASELEKALHVCELALKTREERAAKDLEYAGKEVARAQEECKMARYLLQDYGERVGRAAENWGRIARQRQSAAVIQHWWRLMRIEQSAFERSAEMTKSIKAKVKAEMLALERQVEERDLAVSRSKREKAQLQVRVDELSLERASERDLTELAGQVRDLVQQLERANEEVASLKQVFFSFLGLACFKAHLS